MLVTALVQCASERTVTRDILLFCTSAPSDESLCFDLWRSSLLSSIVRSFVSLVSIVHSSANIMQELILLNIPNLGLDKFWVF